MKTETNIQYTPHPETIRLRAESRRGWLVFNVIWALCVGVFLLLIGLTAFGQNSRYLDQMPLAQTIKSGDMFAVTTNGPGGKGTRNVEATNVLESMKALPNWPKEGNPFDFPFSGSMRVSQNEWPVRVNWSNPLNLFTSPKGTQGVVRQIQILIWQSSTDNPLTKFPVLPTLQFYDLNIAYDGSTVPIVSVPLAYLIGAQTADASNPLLSGTYDTDFFTVQDMGATNSYFMVKLKYPIPYTDGVRIWLTSNYHTDASESTVAASTVVYSDALPSQFDNYRFYATYKPLVNAAMGVNAPGTFTVTQADPYHWTGSGTTFLADVGKWVWVYSASSPFFGWSEVYILSATDDTHCTVSFGNVAQLPMNFSQASYSGLQYQRFYNYTWLNRPAGTRGYLASVTGGNVDTTVDWNPMIYLNQEALPAIIYPGSEDIFGGAFTFGNPFQGLEAGVVTKKSISVLNASPWSAYRHFKNTPVAYANGIRGNLNYNYPCSIFWGAVYYEVPFDVQPSTTDTDAAAYAANLNITQDDRLKRLRLAYDLLKSSGLYSALVDGAALGSDFNQSGTTWKTLKNATLTGSGGVSVVNNGVQFDGASGWMSGTMPAAVSSFTLVCHMQNSSNAGAGGYVLNVGNTDNHTCQGQIGLTSNNTQGKVASTWRDAAGAGTVYSTATDWQDLNSHMVSVIASKSAGTMTNFVDRVNCGGNTAPALTQTLQKITAGALIYDAAPIGNYWKGILKGYFVFNRALTPFELKQAEQALRYFDTTISIPL